jgi:hypothetical protein
MAAPSESAVGDGADPAVCAFALPLLGTCLADASAILEVNGIISAKTASDMDGQASPFPGLHRKSNRDGVVAP